MEGDKKTRPRGTGSLFQRTGSTKYWIAYYHHGKRCQESTGTDNKRKAEKFLQARLGALSAGTFVPDMDKVTVDDLISTLLLQYKNDGNKSLDDDERKWNNRLKPFFGGMKVSHLTTDSIRHYIAQRQTQVFKKSEASVGSTPSNGTINRELALLRAALHQGRKDRKLQTVPYFPMLDESSNVRKGFLKDEQVQRLADECGKVGLWLRTLLEIGIQYGWRRSEPLSLKVGQIDFGQRLIYLTESKNGEGRTAPIVDDSLLKLLKACCVDKKDTDPVFTRKGGHGIKKDVEQPVRTFYKLWAAVCERAGVPGLLFHDLRRTAVSNMRRLEIPESVAMTISGHKTREVFDRYDIVGHSDRKSAMQRVQLLRNEMASKQISEFGNSSSTVAHETEDVTDELVTQMM